MAFLSLLPAIGAALIWFPVALYLLVSGEVGEERTGRLMAAGAGDDRFAEDEGIDGAGASAEEAAIHTIEE